MGKKEISVTFQNNRVVYAPGDVVHGIVNIDLKKPKKVKKIKLNAIGESVVKLKTPDGKQLRNNEKYFHYTIDLYTDISPIKCLTNCGDDQTMAAVSIYSGETLTKRLVALCGSLHYIMSPFRISSGGDTEISTGTHPFPFQVSLKSTLPTSFEGSMGYVRYSLVADIEYQGIFGGKSKATASFTVLDAVDLNTMGSSRTVQQIHCEKSASGVLWWRKNAVTVDLATEKTGFVPGEYVYMNGLIVNGRTKPITTVRIELWQQVTFHGRVKNSAPNSGVLKHDVSSAVATWTMDENSSIGAESAANWERKQLFQIPPLVPSGLRNCRIINIQYYIKAVVIIPGGLSSSLIDAKSNYITIGTVPLMSPEQTQHPATTMSQTLEATAPAIMEMPPEIAAELNAPPPYDPGSSAFGKVLLPSYEEAITGGASLSGGGDNDDAASVVSADTQDNHFVPQYAFFDFNQIYQNPNPSVPSAPPVGV